MFLKKMLRSVPELELFSATQREDLIRSFVPSSLLSKTLRDAAFRSMFISLIPAYLADYLLPGARPTVGLITLGFFAMVIPICYWFICKQIREEFRILLQYLLSGEILPACPRCGYDLQRATHAQCPECGADVKWKPMAQNERTVDESLPSRET